MTYVIGIRVTDLLMKMMPIWDWTSELTLRRMFGSSWDRLCVGSTRAPFVATSNIFAMTL